MTIAKTISIIFSIGICITASTVLMAQVEKGSEVIRLGPESTTRKTSFFSHSMLKVSPLSPLVGIGLVEFEKELTDVFAVQIGAGLTFQKTVLLYEYIKQNIYELSHDIFEREHLDFSENFKEPHTSSRLGYIVTASGRFFLPGAGFDGTYIGPALEYRRFNYLSKSIIPNKTTIMRYNDKFDKVYETNLTYTLRMGSQSTYRWLAIDYYFGLGMVSIKKHTQDIEVNNQGRYTGELHTVKFNILWPEFGFKIGFLLY